MKLPRYKLAWRFGLVGLVLSVILTSGCLPNKAPIISSLEAEKPYLYAGEDAGFKVYACDPDGDDLSYEWSATAGNISGEGAAATWTAPQTPQTCTITVKVSDGRGGEAEMTLSREVVANHTPVIDSLAAKRTRANRGEFIVIECLASDDDDDSLTYTCGGGFYGTGPVITWEAPLELGTHTVTVEVSDGKGAPASGRLTLTVTVNNSPTIESLIAEQMTVIFGKSTAVTCVASDEDGDELAYFWAAEAGEISGEGPDVIWTAPDVCGELVPIAVTVIDDRGGETSQELSIHVRKPG